MLSLSSLAIALTLTACGGSSDEETPDAGVDGPGGGVRAQVVNCTASVTKEILTMTANMYMPGTTTVTAGTTVRFIMDPAHNARSLDQLFNVGYGQTVCVKFNVAGSYRFGCDPHGFTGTVTVQ